MGHAIHAPSMPIKFPYSTPHHRHFMYQVTYVAQEACGENTSVRVRIGGMKVPNETASSLLQIRTFQVLEEWMLPASFVFFSFSFQGDLYPCAIIHWFDRVGDAPDDDTSMWVVKPSVTVTRQLKIAVIHLDTIFRATHLIPVYAAATPIPPLGIPPNQSYDHFRLFYINKFADHHAFTTVF